jgi:2-polyprenyl-3-methyl-5-hydroxy-6-metoxy-1,4-benzoquinol methylase
LVDLNFHLSTGQSVVVTKSEFPGVQPSMADVIARNRGRYMPLGLYCRPGYRFLDFPCGAGYAAELLDSFGILYEGQDVDLPTVAYAQHVYGNPRAAFSQGDLRCPQLERERYDTIGCVEGLEHIEQQFQSPLIGALRAALKPGGTLVVSSPENPTGASGKSVHNEFHLWELTRKDFLGMLFEHFEESQVELLTHRARLTSGVLTTCLYAVCHR